MFNWKVYRELNPHLDKVFKSPSEFINHYNKIGKKNGLKGSVNELYPDFYWEEYRDKYPDLINLNRMEVELHWIKIGRIERRYYKNSEYKIDRKIFKKYKCACIIYHSKEHNNLKWINKCVNSIFAQSFCEFDIHELNYSNEKKFYFSEYIPKIKGKYYSYQKNFDNSYEAMLYLMENCFRILNYDIVFNVDIYDYYEFERFIYQLNEIEKGCYLSSSLCYFIETKDNSDHLIEKNNTMIFDKTIHLITNTDFRQPITPIPIPFETISNQINLFDNILFNSGFCISKKLWEFLDKNNNFIRYRNDFPYSDISFLKRLVENNIPIGIVNRNQIYKRNHFNIDKITTFSIKPNLIPFQIAVIYNYDNYSNFESIYNYLNSNNSNINFFIFSNTSLNLINKLDKNDRKKILEINLNFNDTYDAIDKIGNKIFLMSDYIIYIKHLNFSTKYFILKLDEVNNEDILIVKTNNLYLDYIVKNLKRKFKIDEIFNTIEENIELIIETP